MFPLSHKIWSPSRNKSTCMTCIHFKNPRMACTYQFQTVPSTVTKYSNMSQWGTFSHKLPQAKRLSIYEVPFILTKPVDPSFLFWFIFFFFHFTATSKSKFFALILKCDHTMEYEFVSPQITMLNHVCMSHTYCWGS